MAIRILMKFFYIALFLMIGFAQGFCENNSSQTLENVTSDIIGMGKESLSKVISKASGLTAKLHHEEQYQKEDFNEVWSDVFDKLKKGGALEEEAGSPDLPEKTLIGRDKQNVREDINEILDDVIEILTDGNYKRYRKKVHELETHIDTLKSDIVRYREEKISAPVKSVFHTTKEGYDDKIASAKEEIKIYQKRLAHEKEKFKAYFLRTGVPLNSAQVDLLLSNVDGGDMIKMISVLNLLNQITEHLTGILQESHEELKAAKKYYAIYLLSVDLTVHIYQQYIDKVDHVYLARLNKIIDNTKSLLAQSKNLMRSATDSQQKIYRQNIRSQKMTLQAADMYRKNLLRQKQKIVKARKIARENLLLARNTYETVSLSSQLYAIMKENENLFNQLLTVQTPELVPFQNAELQQKYNEITAKLLQESEE